MNAETWGQVERFLRTPVSANQKMVRKMVDDGHHQQTVWDFYGKNASPINALILNLKGVGRMLALTAANHKERHAEDLNLVLFPNRSSLAVDSSILASEERFSKAFSKAFHANPQPMSITTLDEGMYVDVNESFLNTLGYAREDVIGHTSLELRIWTSI